VRWQDNGLPAFIDPRGGFHYEGRWQGPEAPGCQNVSAETLFAENARRGLRPDGWTGSAKWKREADIPPEVFFPAIEAIGEAEP